MLTKCNGTVSFQYLMGNFFNLVFARCSLALLSLSLGFFIVLKQTKVILEPNPLV